MYILDQNGAPLYEQLYAALKSDIERGRFRMGEKLPSKRQIAQACGVSVITAEAAYAQLAAEGHIVSRQRSGYFVQAAPAQKLKEFPREMADRNEEKQQGEVRFDFKTNTVDSGCFPFALWAKLMRSALSTGDSAILEHTDSRGVYVLREAIAEYLYEFRGISALPSQILVCAGSEVQMNLLVQLLGRDAVYNMESPGYPKLQKLLRINGALLQTVPVDQEGMEVLKLSEAEKAVVHVTPAHHFPLGIVMPIGRRQALLEWADRFPDRYIIEDDYDSEFRFASRPIPALKGMDAHDKVIYMNTFTKSIAPSMRISYMVLPEALLQRYRKELSFYACTVPNLEQYALAEFIRSGGLQRHINRMRSRYKARRDALLHALRSSSLHECIGISGVEAGMHLLLFVKNGMNEKQLAENALKQGVRVYGLSDYYGNESERCPAAAVILGYCGIHTSQILEAVQALERAWMAESK